MWKLLQHLHSFLIHLSGSMPIIHATNCKLIFEKDFIQNNKIRTHHWFSTHFLAEKELGDLKSCKLCNP